ncbi:MAG: hypothetical protein MI741_04540, partial [Rhodospirillales bacterium]|nr:hypothetical protein [Rhodospirillales bacterium]
LASLRKKLRHPVLEINHDKAESLGIAENDSVILETPYGEIVLQARLTQGLAHDVVCTQHGWWQACRDLNLSGHDLYSARGANVNLLIPDEFTDKISGSVHMRGLPCNVRKSRADQEK